MTERYFWVGSQPEKDDLKFLQSEGLTRVAGTRRLFERPTLKEKRMRLDLGIMAGPESKAFLADLTKQIDRLERLTKGKGLATQAEETDEEASETDTSDVGEAIEDEDFAPKKSSKAKASSFEDEDETPEEAEEEEAPVAKKTKAKKVTMDDVNDACKARAHRTGGKKGIAEVRTILMKKFKTQSIADLKPEQYAAAVVAMTG